MYSFALPGIRKLEQLKPRTETKVVHFPTETHHLQTEACHSQTEAVYPKSNNFPATTHTLTGDIISLPNKCKAAANRNITFSYILCSMGSFIFTHTNRFIIGPQQKHIIPHVDTYNLLIEASRSLTETCHSRTEAYYNVQTETNHSQKNSCHFQM